MAFIDAYHPVSKMTEGVQTVSSLLQRSEGNVLVVWDPEGTGSTVLINPMQVKSQIEVSFIGYMEAAQKRGKKEVKSLFRTHTHTNIGQTFVGRASLTIHTLVCIIF